MLNKGMKHQHSTLPPLEQTAPTEARSRRNPSLPSPPVIIEVWYSKNVRLRWSSSLVGHPGGRKFERAFEVHEQLVGGLVSR